MLAGLGSSTAWALLQRKGEALQARFEQQRTITREVERFRERAREIGSIDELVRDRRTLAFVLEAFQLESEIDKRAVVRRLLTDDPGDMRSFANRMVDPRYRQINRAFGGVSGPPLADQRLVDRIVSLTLTNRFEKAQGEANPGLREALYFKRTIRGVSNVNQLMSDRVLTAVARGALGLPEKFGMLEFEQQRAILSRRIDFSQFRDERGVDRFVQAYLLRTQGGQSAPTNPMLGLLGGGDGPAGLLPLLGRTISFRA